MYQDSRGKIMGFKTSDLCFVNTALWTRWVCVLLTSCVLNLLTNQISIGNSQPLTLLTMSRSLVFTSTLANWNETSELIVDLNYIVMYIITWITCGLHTLLHTHYNFYYMACNIVYYMEHYITNYTIMIDITWVTLRLHSDILLLTYYIKKNIIFKLHEYYIYYIYYIYKTNFIVLLLKNNYPCNRLVTGHVMQYVITFVMCV